MATKWHEHALMFRRLFKINLCDCGMRCQRHIYTFAACERTCSICCATVFGGGGHKVFALHCGCVAWQQRDEIAEIKSINADIRLHTTAIFMFIYARMRSFLFTLRLPVCVYLKFL